MKDPLSINLEVPAPTAESLLEAFPELSAVLTPDWPTKLGSTEGEAPVGSIVRLLPLALAPGCDRQLVALASKLTLDPWGNAAFEAAAKTLGMTKGFFHSAVRAERDKKGALAGDRDAAVRVVAKQFYHDTQGYYYRKLPSGHWGAMNAEKAKRQLRVVCKLSDTVEKGYTYSEVDVALQYIETEQLVEGALPFPLNPKTVVDWNNQTFLNVARNKLKQPAEKPVEWGEKFPRLASYLDGLFIDKQNLNVFLAWLQVWYRSAYGGSPRRGQALFIAGPTGTGKSFLSIAVIGRIFDGYADARGYFVENKNFNHTMFDHAVWSLDDSTILGDNRAHQKFSGLVKAVVANPSFSFDRKWGYCGHVPFSGRFICTLNDDPVSIGILPDTDQSLMDKVIMLRTSNKECPLSDRDAAGCAILDEELPHFLRWLLDMPLPDGVTANSRFGIESWHDREVLDEARASSTSSGIMEIVDRWRKAYAKNIDEEDGQTDKEAGIWRGTSTDLFVKMRVNPATEHLVGRLSPVALGRHLSTAIETGYKYARRERVGKKGSRIIEILLHEND